MEKKVISPLKKFVVEKGGNPRGKGISKEDIKQALRDIVEWYKAHAKGYYAKLAAIKGASEDDIKKLQTGISIALPISIQGLLSTHNGGFQLLDTYVTLTAAEIATIVDAKKKLPKWKPSLVPIAKNIDNDLLCIDAVEGKEGGVATWSEDGTTEVLAESMGSYLESIRDSLLLKKLEYDEVLGLIAIVDAKK